MTEVPASQLTSLALAIERIGGEGARGKGSLILAESAEGPPTYGDVADLSADVGTFNLALQNAGVSLKAVTVSRVRQAVQLLSPEIPVCEKCGGIPIDIVGGMAIVRSAGQACPDPTCGGYLKEPAVAQPYVAWTTGALVPPTITLDFKTVPGDKIPLTKERILEEGIVIAPTLMALLHKEGVELTQFLLWLWHGPEAIRFHDPRKALLFLSNPDAETGNANVTRNWVTKAKDFRTAPPVVIPASLERTVARSSGGGTFVLGNDPPHAELTRFLGDAFSKDDLRRFMSRLPYADRMMGEVRDESSLVAFAFEAVALMQRWAQFNTEFFHRLILERPNHANAISELAQRFNLTVPTPAKLRDALGKVLPATFAAIVFRINAPASEVPPDTAPQATRAIQLVKWAILDAKRMDELSTLTVEAAPGLF